MNQDEKFKERKEFLLKRPTDSDTKLLDNYFVDYDDCIALLESWYWEGISAKSLIFASEDYEKGLVEPFLKKFFEDADLTDKRTTEKKSGDYYFLNFDFQTE